MKYTNAGKFSLRAVTTAALAAVVLSGTAPVTGLQLPSEVPGTSAVSGSGHGGGGHGGSGNGHEGSEDSPSAQNVILMVGDGMGPGQREAIRLSLVGLTGELEMDSMPSVGRVHTNSADPETFVTDSAAAATAMSTGVKTYNGAIGEIGRAHV